MDKNTRIAAGTRKGSKVLLRNGSKYQKNKVLNECIYWRRRRKDCGAFVKTNHFDMNDHNANIIVHQEGNHGHDEDIDVIKTDEFKQQLRENIIANPTAPTKRIYAALVVNNTVEGRDDNLPNFSSVRSSMCRQRPCLVPPIPPSIHDSNIDGPCAETWRNENFILQQTCQSDFIDINGVIFCTNNDLFALAKFLTKFLLMGPLKALRDHLNKCSPFTQCT